MSCYTNPCDTNSLPVTPVLLHTYIITLSSVYQVNCINFSYNNIPYILQYSVISLISLLLSCYFISLLSSVNYLFYVLLTFNNIYIIHYISSLEVACAGKCDILKHMLTIQGKSHTLPLNYIVHFSLVQIPQVMRKLVPYLLQKQRYAQLLPHEDIFSINSFVSFKTQFLFT